MIRAIVGPAACALLLAGLVSTPITAQPRDGGTVSARLAWGTQLSGFTRGFSQLELTTPLGMGLTVSGPLDGDRWRIGLGTDLYLVTDLKERSGPVPTDLESGTIWAVVASVAYRLDTGCERICVQASLSGGLSRHDYSFEQTFDDIIARTRADGWWPSAGLGLEVWLPGWVEALSLTVEDRLTWPADDGRLADRSPIQMLSVGLAWTW